VKLVISFRSTLSRTDSQLYAATAVTEFIGIQLLLDSSLIISLSVSSFVALTVLSYRSANHIDSFK